MLIGTHPDCSSTVVISEMDKVGPKSSSVIVNIAESHPSTIFALVALEILIVAVSSSSSIESERVAIVKLLDSSPGSKINVPLVAV